MVTVTDGGLEWMSDKWLGNVTDEIDAIALGTGTGNERDGSTGLANEVHRELKSSSDVTFPETNNVGGFNAVINITGGQEVPDGTAITEMAVIAGDNGGTDTMIVIDEFEAVRIDEGHTEEFTMPGGPTR